MSPDIVPDIPWFARVLIQALISLGLVLSAALPAYFGLKGKLLEISKNAKEARDQTANTHTTNLREELDERHDEVVDALREVARDVRGLREDHHATRKDIGMLYAEDRATRRETSQIRQELNEHLEELKPIREQLFKLAENDGRGV